MNSHTDIPETKLRRLISSRNATLIAMLIILGIAAALWVQSLELPYPSDVFPKLVFASVGVLGVLIIGIAIADKSKDSSFTSEPKRKQNTRIMATLVATALYIVFTELLGFYTSTLLFLCSMFLVPLFTERELEFQQLIPMFVVRVVTAVLITAVVFVCFRILLKVPTVKGLFL